MELRSYQHEAVEALYQYLREKDGSPVIVAPTASGKSILIAKIAMLLLPDRRLIA